MPGQLKFGITGINGGATSYPEELVGLAQAAETAGFDSLWAGEHHVLAASSTMIPANQSLPEPGLRSHLCSCLYTHHSPGDRCITPPAAPAAHPGQGTGQPGCPFRRSVDCGDWRRLGRSGV